MLIVNADDWGRQSSETDAALACFRHGSLSRVSAMVYMADSQRASELAKDAGVDVGLHLNLSQHFDAACVPPGIVAGHRHIARFLKRGRYAGLLYNPMLARGFREVCQVQIAEFSRLYGQAPSHYDGHQHQHLCANLLLCTVFPRGAKVRRSAWYWPGEKSWANRTYRGAVGRWLARCYNVTDYFVDLAQCLDDPGRWDRVIALASVGSVELMTHPVREREYRFLTSEAYRDSTHGILATGPSASQSALLTIASGRPA